MEEYKQYASLLLSSQYTLVNLKDRCAILWVDEKQPTFFVKSVVPVELWQLAINSGLEEKALYINQEQIDLYPFCSELCGALIPFKVCEIQRVVSENETRICDLIHNKDGSFTIEYQYVSWHGYAGSVGTIPDSMCDRRDTLSISELLESDFKIK